MAIVGGDGSIILTTKIDPRGLKEGISSIKNGVSSLQATFNKLASTIGIAFSVALLVKFGKQSSTLATKTEASVQRLIDIYGSASKAVGDFIDTNARALGMSKAAAASYASVYGNLFSVWADQATNAELTNRYLNMTAVVASKTGRTVEDVQERIRSGLLGNTEAIEDLGIFVNIKTIEMTDAFQQMANGKSWEQLDAYTQQQIRSMAILEQATSKYGNEVAQTTALTKSQLQAAWQDFQATWGQVINKVLIPILKVLTQILTTATVVTQSLFGISKNTISESDAIASATNNQEALTDAVKETEKAAKKVVAPFDDLRILTDTTKENILSGNVGISAGILSPDISIGMQAGKSPILILFEKIQELARPSIDELNKLSYALQPFKSFIAQGVTDFYNNFLLPVGTWVLGEGFPKFVNAITNGLNLIDWEVLNASLSVFFEQLAKPTTFVYDAIIDFYNLFLVPLSTWVIGEAFPRVVDAISNQLARVDWDKLNKAVDDLWQALEPFAENIGGGLVWFWEKAITPLIGWSLENLIPAQIDLITAAIKFIDEIITAAEPALLWFWETFLVPIRDYIWQAVIDFINLLTETFKALTDWAKENQSTVEDITKVVLGFLAGIWVYNTTKKIIVFCQQLGDAFVKLGSKMAEGGLKGAFFAAAVGILAAGIVVLADKWDQMTPAEQAITILGGLAAAATAAAIAIAIFHTAWSVGLAAAAIAGGLALLGLSFAFTDTGDTGDAAKKAADSFYSSYDWDKDFTLPSVGYARGTVVPPNRPHLAWFGDNKQEPEVVSPISTMKQAFTEAMIEMGGNFGGGNTEVVLEIDGREFGRAVVEQGNRENRRIGTRLVIV